jgi:CobQ-like glutamine amidotransferase family enzyme
MELKLAYFYPTLMNLYGDRGNVQMLAQRCRWRGIGFQIAEIGLGESPDMGGVDLAFFGGGQDKEQIRIGADLVEKKAVNLKAAIEDDLVMLAVCGGYQLLGDYYQPVRGTVLSGIGALDLHTEGGEWRAIGNVLVNATLNAEQDPLLMVGFENHSGRTYLGPKCHPFGQVVVGFGNNGLDGGEGVRYRNCFGTYLHGPLLPKNPLLADYLITLALERKYGKTVQLDPLDDTLEETTRQYVIERIKKDKPARSNRR